jgi:MFS family permease
MYLKALLRSLSHRNFRLFFLGQGISLVGTWMQQIAMSWVVFQLTGSSFQLGLVLFCGQIPSLILSPLAGVLVDRWNRRRLLLFTQSLAMIQAFALAALDMTGTIAVWQILPLSVFLGVVNTFDITGRQTFLTEMVTNRNDLSNAIALNSSLMNIARLLGPSLAGLLLAETSASVCFLINGISYFAVLIALLAMRLAPRVSTHHGKGLREGLREGFLYAFNFLPIRIILLTCCTASMVGSSYNVILPEYSVQILHGNARTLGMMSTAAGLGALGGALFLAARSSVLGLGRWIWIALVLMGIGFIAFAWATQFWMAYAALTVIGFGLMVQIAASNTLLQTIVEEDKRGRVMSFFTMAFLGMAPFGSLLTGYVAGTLGIPFAFIMNGCVCLISALAFFVLLPHLRELIHPIYVRLNIISPIVSGIEAASELKLMTKE